MDQLASELCLEREEKNTLQAKLDDLQAHAQQLREQLHGEFARH